MKTQTALYPCPVEGCLSFPWGTQDEVDAHVARADHVFEIRRSNLPAVSETVSVDRPEGQGTGTGTGRRTPAAQAYTWTKVEGEWAVRVPVAAHQAGDVVTISKKDGSTAEGRLGRIVKKDEVFDYWTAEKAGGDPTAAQVAFWSKLAEEAGLDVEATRKVLEGNGLWTKANLSTMIDDLKKAPKVDRPSKPSTKKDRDLEVGRVYGAKDGRFVRVYQSRAGRLYGKFRVEGGWEYDETALSSISGPASAEAAAAWGHEHGSCAFCGRGLEDDGPERSVQVGYGPVCARKYGLPWG